jgi:hypothetical protein
LAADHWFLPAALPRTTLGPIYLGLFGRAMGLMKGWRTGKADGGKINANGSESEGV